MTSTEMIKLLKKNGFVQISGGKGSHKKFYNQSTDKSTIVPDHKQELGKGFEHRILKQDGLK
jgi:YcfA-like protein.